MRIDRNLATALEQYRAIGIQVADALAYAKTQGVLFTTSTVNLLLDATGTVWVTDFGLAKLKVID